MCIWNKLVPNINHTNIGYHPRTSRLKLVHLLLRIINCLLQQIHSSEFIQFIHSFLRSFVQKKVLKQKRKRKRKRKRVDNTVQFFQSTWPLSENWNLWSALHSVCANCVVHPNNQHLCQLYAQMQGGGVCPPQLPRARLSLSTECAHRVCAPPQFWGAQGMASSWWWWWWSWFIIIISMMIIMNGERETCEKGSCGFSLSLLQAGCTMVGDSCHHFQKMASMDYSHLLVFFFFFVKKWWRRERRRTSSSCAEKRKRERERKGNGCDITRETTWLPRFNRSRGCHLLSFFCCCCGATSLATSRNFSCWASRASLIPSSSSVAPAWKKKEIQQ